MHAWSLVIQHGLMVIQHGLMLEQGGWFQEHLENPEQATVFLGVFFSIGGQMSDADKQHDIKTHSDHLAHNH